MANNQTADDFVRMIRATESLVRAGGAGRGVAGSGAGGRGGGGGRGGHGNGNISLNHENSHLS